MRPRLTATALFLATLAATTASAQLNKLPNGYFDTSTDGWTYSGPSGGSLTWEAGDGSPTPGSLALTATSPGTYFALPNVCFDIEESRDWQLDARFKLVPGGIGVVCEVDLVYYSGPACTGFPSHAFQTDATALPNGWFAVNRGDPHGFYTDARSVGLRLYMFTAGAGACRFDSVVLTGPGSIIEIPALRGEGLAILAGLLALAGLIALRVRRRGGACRL